MSCCCENDCVIGSDKFDRGDSTNLGADWTEVAGAWEIKNQRLKATASNGIARFDTPNPSGEPDTVIIVEFKAPATGDQIRGIVAYTDANNYLYGQVEVEDDCGELTLWDVTAGVHTQVGETARGYFNKGRWHHLKVCYTSGPYGGTGPLEATVIDKDGNIWHIRGDADQDGDYAGLGTGTIYSSVEFDNFVYEYIEDETKPECRDCDSDLGCVIYADNYDRATLGCLWTHISGTAPTIVSNELKFSATGVVRCDVPKPTEDTEQYLEVDFCTQDAGDQIRVYVDWEDANNHHYVEVTVNGAAPAVSTLKIYKVSAGIASQLGTTVNATLHTETCYTVLVCMQATSIQANVGDQGLVWFDRMTDVQSTTEHGGPFVALGVSSVTDYVVFDNFSYERLVSDEWPQCKYCVNPSGDCGPCEDGTAPTYYYCTIAGMANVNTCQNCPDFNTTYVVERNQTFNVTLLQCANALPVGGNDGVCHWESVPTDAACHSGTSGYMHDGVTLKIYRQQGDNNVYVEGRLHIATSITTMEIHSWEKNMGSVFDCDANDVDEELDWCNCMVYPAGLPPYSCQSTDDIRGECNDLAATFTLEAF